MKIFQRHVLDDLAAYEEGRLDPRRSDLVKTHIAECEECRGALDAVQRARRILEALPAVAMPPREVQRLTAALRRAGDRSRPVRFGLVAAAASVVIALGLTAYFLSRGIGPDLITKPGPAGLAPLASDLHRRLEAGDLALAFESSDPAQIRQWQFEQRAPVASLAAPVVRAGWPAIRVRGSAVVDAGGAPASVVTYDVDGRPVTLVTARERDIPDAPEGAWLAKRVYVSRDARGRPTLTWTTAGQTYAIVSSLPGVGQSACLVCHAEPKFRERLDRAVFELFPERAFQPDRFEDACHLGGAGAPGFNGQPVAVPGDGQRPQLVERHERAARQTVRLAPLVHGLFRPEEEHRGSRVNDVVPPVRGRNGEVDHAGFEGDLTAPHEQSHRLTRVRIGCIDDGVGVQRGRNAQRVPGAIGEIGFPSCLHRERRPYSREWRRHPD
jgi:hypothetical protein